MIGVSQISHLNSQQLLVKHSSLSCQLQRASPSDNCIQTLDLQFSYVCGRAFEVGSSILCLLAADKLPLELEHSGSAKPDPAASCDGGKLWSAIVRISCHRKGEKRRAEQS